KSQELGLAIAASKHLSGTAFVDAKVVGPIQQVEVEDAEGRKTVQNRVVMEVTDASGNVHRTEVTSENVVVTSGMGTARELATRDQTTRTTVEGKEVEFVSREAQMTPADAARLKASQQLLSGEDALRTSRHDYKDENVVVVGGSATAAWAAEHAQEGG